MTKRRRQTSTLHVMFGKPAARVLEAVLSARSDDAEVAWLEDDLSIGPIDCSGERRAQMLCKHFFASAGSAGLLVKNSAKLWNRVQRHPGKLLVWASPTNATELAGLFALAARTNKPFEIIAPRWTRPAGNGRRLPIATGLLAHEDIIWWLDEAPRIQPENDKRLQSGWFQLMEGRTWLRVIRDRTLQSVAEDYFDTLLFHCTGLSGTEARRAVSLTMTAAEDAGHFVTSDFLFWRLQTLAELGAMECDGWPEQPIHSHDVRVRNNIGPYLSFGPEALRNGRPHRPTWLGKP